MEIENRTIAICRHQCCQNGSFEVLGGSEEIKTELQTAKSTPSVDSSETYARAVKSNWLFNFGRQIVCKIQLSLIFIDTPSYIEYSEFRSDLCDPAKRVSCGAKWLENTTQHQAIFGWYFNNIFGTSSK